MRRSALILALLLPLCALALPPADGGAVHEAWPPVRPAALPPFELPRAGETLDGPWEYVQTLYDVDTTLGGWQSHLNAFPVSLVFTHQGRGYLATLHTVFKSTDGGRSWRNLDAYPPPRPHSSDFVVMRAPNFISSLAVRPTQRDSVRFDSVYVSTFDSDNNRGSIRLLRYSAGEHRLSPYQQFRAGHWLTGLSFPDSNLGIAFAGLDAELYRNDSLSYFPPDSLRMWALWEELERSKVFFRSGRGDSLEPLGTWVQGVATVGDFIIATGSHHWISRDGGYRWRVRAAADAQFNPVVSFRDSTYGIVGGGRVTPERRGWAYLSSDGGRTWSGRVLDVDYPVRAVLSVSPAIAFAGGGHYPLGVGKIWKTTNGGAEWTEEIETDAEIRALGATRSSGAYVDVIAVGVFPDFHGGVWRSRVFLPDPAGAVIYGDPDTLDFGAIAPGTRDTLTTTLFNTGTASGTITGVTGSGAFFPLWSGGNNYVLEPGATVSLSVELRAEIPGALSGAIRVAVQQANGRTEYVEITVRAEVAASNDPPEEFAPRALELAVWPNPSNAVFDFRYELPRAGRAHLALFDVTGREVAVLLDAQSSAGSHRLAYHAANLSSGLYFARLESPGGSITRKLLLLK